MKDASLTIVRRFRAPPARVFAACSEPETMRRWYGPREWRCTHLESDFRVGGRFAFRMTGPEGEKGAEGEFAAIEAPSLIVHSWRWTDEETVSRITYRFEPDGDGTVMTFTQEGLDDAATAQGHEEGWSEAFDKLERAIEEARAA